MRDTLATVWRMTGRKPAELEGPGLPAGAAHVWEWFCLLHSTRQVGMAANPISHLEMQAFFGLEQVAPASWELELLREFDRVAMAPESPPK